MKEKVCPKCNGKGTVLVDITKGYYPNRAARRAAHNEKITKLLPCPDCSNEGLTPEEQDFEAMKADINPTFSDRKVQP